MFDNLNKLNHKSVNLDQFILTNISQIMNAFRILELLCFQYSFCIKLYILIGVAFDYFKYIRKTITPLISMFYKL